jgi:excisionase family DNA binding protein
MAAPLLTVRQAAARLGCAASTVRALVHANEITHVRIGLGRAKPRICFEEADIDAYIERNRRVAPADQQQQSACPSAPSRRRERRSLKDLPEAARYA